MDRRDTLDLAAAFAIGALLGLGATLLLRPKRGGARGGARELKELGERARDRARRGVEGAAGAAAAAGHDLAGGARDLLAEFRAETGDIVAAAREELARAAAAHVADTRKALRKTAKRLRRA